MVSGEFDDPWIDINSSFRRCFAFVKTELHTHPQSLWVYFHNLNHLLRGDSMSKRVNKMFSAVTILALMLMALPAGSVLAAPTGVFINEIHYDNAGTDSGEAIEVAGPAGTDLTGWSLVLYNGSGGASYNTTALSSTIPDLGGGFGVVVVTYPSNGIQN